MIDGSTGIAVLSILFIVGVLCRYSYYLGWKACEKAIGVASKEFNEKYKHLDKLL